MNALNRLAGLLRIGANTSQKPLTVDNSIDAVIAQLEHYTRAGTQAVAPEDLQQQAVRRFWETRGFENLKDARLVSFGMCIPHHPSGPCIMEDRQRFQAVLDRQTGIDQWLDDPRWYRRCYQGLLRSYFTYDANIESASAVGRQNWGDLRDYLHDRTRNIVDKKLNPDWVVSVNENRQLFGEFPCAPYANAMLRGDHSAVDHLCEQLGIIKASWFLKELVLAQVRQATKLGHERFKELIPTLLELLADNPVLRDRGLILMLDKYASVAQPAINEPLRNAAVDWWGNPWLPSNEMRWGGVVRAAREMVSEWLKLEFIEAFFAKLAEDGVGDKRRANFWLRYAKSMNNIQFALGSTALHSRDRDFVALRQKMKGLITELKNDSSNNAFVMTMGNLVAVEFGGMGAFYGYDTRKALPFNLTQPVVTAKNANNSLKHNQRILWMKHQDGILGWTYWEEMFEATLSKEFNITPNAPLRQDSIDAKKTSTTSRPITHQILAPSPSQTHQQTSPAMPIPLADGFSISDLISFSVDNKLRISSENRILWVRTDDNDLYVNKMLLKWKFNYRPGKGWWR